MNKKKDNTNIIKFNNKSSSLERKIEAILFAASEPLDLETIEKRIDNKAGVKKSLEKLQFFYKSRGINLVCIKDKWSFRTSEDLSKTLALQKSIQKKLSKGNNRNPLDNCLSSTCN